MTVRIQHSSYMKLSRIIMSEGSQNVKKKRRMYIYDTRACFSCHSDPIGARMELERYRTPERHAYMYCSQAQRRNNQNVLIASDSIYSASPCYAQSPYLRKGQLIRFRMKSKRTILCVEHTRLLMLENPPSNSLGVGIMDVRTGC